MHLLNILTKSGHGSRCGRDPVDAAYVTKEIALVTCKSCKGLHDGMVTADATGGYHWRGK